MQRKLSASLLLALLFAGILMVGLKVSPVSASHVVDGVISPGEYATGMAVQLVGRTDPTWKMDAYVDWNTEYLYVAINEPVPPGTGTQSWIELAMDAGAARSVLDGFAVFCNGDQEHAECPKIGGTWGWTPYAFLVATDTATEFRIKYTDFGIAIGDTIKISIDRNQGPAPPPPYGFAGFWPEGAVVYDGHPDPTTWGDVHLTPQYATLYIDPAVVTKSSGDVGTTFDVSVKIKDVTDLFGFDIKITWDNSLITFASLDDTPLNTVFTSYFEPLNDNPPHYQTGAGYVRFAAVKTGLPPGFTGSATLFTLTFNIVKSYNFPHSASIHFDPSNVKLSDSSANSITATLTDGLYNMGATVPDIDFTLVNPNVAKPYEYGKYFEVQVYATHITSTLTDYDLKLDYTSELLTFVKAQTWGALGTGTADSTTQGVVEVSISGGTPSTGNSILLVTLTFKVTFDDSITHIWRTESPQTLAAHVSLDTAYGDLSFSEGNLKVDGTGPTPITLPSTVNITINLIQGDVTCDGVVNIFDLGTVARFYDQKAPPAPEKYDVKTDGTIDIYDLVAVATNFNYYIPDNPP